MGDGWDGCAGVLQVREGRVSTPLYSVVGWDVGDWMGVSEERRAFFCGGAKGKRE